MSEKAVNYYRNPLKKGTEAYEIKKPDIAFKLTCIGTLIPKTTNEIAGSNWLLGCDPSCFFLSCLRQNGF